MTYTDEQYNRLVGNKGRLLPPRKPRNLWQRLMVELGFRTACCYAKPYEPVGWERSYCSNCKRRLA